MRWVKIKRKTTRNNKGESVTEICLVYPFGIRRVLHKYGFQYQAYYYPGSDAGLITSHKKYSVYLWDIGFINLKKT